MDKLIKFHLSVDGKGERYRQALTYPVLVVLMVQLVSFSEDLRLMKDQGNLPLQNEVH